LVQKQGRLARHLLARKQGRRVRRLAWRQGLVWFPASTIGQTGHDISFPLNNQRILELIGWKFLLKSLQFHPSSVCCSLVALAFPPNKQFLDVVGQAAHDHLRRLRTGPIVERSRQRPWRWRRSALVWLEQAGVEHVVKTCRRRQIQPVRDVTHAFLDLKWPIEARTQLAATMCAD
jgi:hypothetical protein